MISVANAPGNDEITGEQTLVFKAALPHINRAVRIHRELRLRDLDRYTAPDRLESSKKNTRILRLEYFQTTATASCHMFIAAARKARCVFAEMRWRWTLKVL
jgi:hypothetical protein